MKKTLSTLIVVALTTGISLGQSLKDSEVPSTISQNFKSEYSNASDTEWDREGDKFAVTFTVPNKQEVHLVYDEKGALQEKYMALPKKDIPPSINSYLNSNYQNQMIRNCWVRQAGSKRVYKVEVLDSNVGMGTISGTYNGLSVEAPNTATTNPNPDNINSGIRVDTTAPTQSALSEGASRILYFDMSGRPIESDSAAYNGKEVTLDTASIKADLQNKNKSSEKKDNKHHKKNKNR